MRLNALLSGPPAKTDCGSSFQADFDSGLTNYKLIFFPAPST